MNWTDFSKKIPKDTGNYLTAMISNSEKEYYYCVCYWDGNAFTDKVKNCTYHMVVMMNNKIVSSETVMWYMQITSPPK